MLEAKYRFLESLKIPRTIQEALRLYGIHEVKGTTHNQVILDWAKELGISSIVKDDEQAWCGLFAGVVVTRAGKELPLKSYDILRALKWVAFGREIPKVDASLGDVLIFKREGGGHVGFYVGEDAAAYHVLGGNQSDMVCMTRIAKNRLFAVRRPIYNNQPASVKRYVLGATGPVSTNEK
jgi:uncharacterized protein (TIGR02594 family)